MYTTPELGGSFILLVDHLPLLAPGFASDSMNSSIILVFVGKDERFRNVSKTILKRLGVSNGFPVLYLNAEAYRLSSDSTDFNGSRLFGQLLAQI